MNITIIGTGKMARGIGTRLVAGGNSVTLLSRNPEKGGTGGKPASGSAEGGERSGRSLWQPHPG